MGDTDQQIMDIPDSIVPVDLKDARIAKKEVVETSHYQHAFWYDNMAVDLGNFHTININCVYQLCQGLKIYAGGKMSTKCSYDCYLPTEIDN